MPMTPLPTPPSRSDSANFATRGDAFMAALPTFVTEANALETNVNAKESSASGYATAANGSATTATTQAGLAAASALSAAQSIGAPLWVSGTTYAAGLAVTSPITLTIFRRLISGAGVTDPSADATNWGSAVTPVASGGTGAGTQPAAQNVMGIYAGMLFDFAGSAAPAGYLLCDGSAVSRTTYALLFSAIGTTWGAGNGTTTFNVPDLRRKTTIGAGGTAVSGPANTVGATGGVEAQTIASGNLPAHIHAVSLTTGTESATHTHTDSGHFHGINNVANIGGGGSAPNILGAGSAVVNTIAAQAALGTQTANHTHTVTGNTGNGGFANTDLNVMQPSAVVTKIIKT